MEAFLCEALVHVFQAIAEAVNTFATTQGMRFHKEPSVSILFNDVKSGVSRHSQTLSK